MWGLKYFGHIVSQKVCGQIHEENGKEVKMIIKIRNWPKQLVEKHCLKSWKQILRLIRIVDVPIQHFSHTEVANIIRGGN